MPFPRLGWSRVRVQLLAVIHMFPEVVQLRLIELRREICIAFILQVLQRGAQTGDDRISDRALNHDLLQTVEPGLKLVCDCGMVQQAMVIL